MTPRQACPLCGGDETTKLYTLADPNFATVRCRRCRFIFMSPYPTDAFLHEHYLSIKLYGFEGETPELYARSMNDRIVLFETLFGKIGLPLRKGYAVDFGAGMGMVVAALKKLGFDAIGIEKNPMAAAVGKTLFEVDIFDIDLEKLSCTIDLFTLFDVLEHIKYPKNFLAAVREKMSEDATIIGAVPNYNGIGRILHGTRSASLIFPEHVNQFTKQTLQKTLDDSGFDVLYTGFPPPYGVTITLRLRAKLRKILGEGSAMRLIANLLVKLKKYVVYPLPNWFAESTGLFGHSLVFVARKRANSDPARIAPSV